MILPLGWAATTLGELTSPTIDQGGPTGDPFSYVDISSIDNQAKRIVESRRLPAGVAPSRARQRLQAGDVLVSMTRPNLNAVAIVPPELEGSVGSTGFCVLRALEIDARWLYYAVQTRAFVEAMCGVVQGALYPAVRPKDVVGFGIPLPPYPEQRRIVVAIEEHLSRLDAAVTALTRVQALIPRYRASVLKAGCDGRLTGDTVRQSSTGSMSMPSSWVETSLERLNPPDRPCAYGVLQPGPHVSGGVPLVRVGDINGGRIDTTALKRIAPAVASAYTRTRLRGGEVLMTLVGTIGRTAVVPPQLAGGNVARAVAVIPVIDDVLPEWVEIWFRSDERISEMAGKAHEVARKTLNLEDVRSARITIPPLEEQRRIVADVERRLPNVNAVSGEVDAALIRVGRMRQSLLKRAFEGKLVPQDPNDEPASFLLERIRARRATVQRAKRARERA